MKSILMTLSLKLATPPPTLRSEGISSPLPVTKRGERSREKKVRMVPVYRAGSVILNYGSRSYLDIVVATENMLSNL